LKGKLPKKPFLILFLLAVVPSVLAISGAFAYPIWSKETIITLEEPIQIEIITSSLGEQTWPGATEFIVYKISNLAPWGFSITYGGQINYRGPMQYSADGWGVGLYPERVKVKFELDPDGSGLYRDIQPGEKLTIPGNSIHYLRVQLHFNGDLPPGQWSFILLCDRGERIES
jgi:hypothetical protein